MTDVLEVRQFAHLDHARLEFGDLTILVGAQATGKSLLLQWLKMAIDTSEVYRALKESGNDVSSGEALLDLMFGYGMAKGWRKDQTTVQWNGQPIIPDAWPRQLRRTGGEPAIGRVFYIPAHRALLLAEGWPAPFLKLTADTPVVARLFSQTLYQQFSGRPAADLFPRPRQFKTLIRQAIDQAVFHGGKVALRKDGLKYRLALHLPGEVELPFMTWTAGQREFTPLLLGLYHLMPGQRLLKRKEIDWVVIEEPEMGLHPNALHAFLLMVLDLLWRGYRVVLSTHSPLVLDFAWFLLRVQATSRDWRHLRQGFEVPASKPMREVLEHALAASLRVFHLKYGPTPGRIVAEDISPLDPASAFPGEATWGGLTEFSSKFGEAVCLAANAAEGS